jgi:type I restriction-modification system DNA methylase subunit
MAEFEKEFRRLVDKVGRSEGKRAYEVFGEWLEMAFLALSSPVWHMIAPDKHAEAEARYAKIVARFRDAETLEAYSHMLALLVQRLEHDRSDAMSGLFMEMAANDHIGQFFTPPEVCRLMAEMIVGDAEALRAEAKSHGRSFITMQEPAAGAGGMILATTEALRMRGMNPAKDLHWIAVDVDVLAVHACYVQMALLGISGVVVHGNTLTLDEWSATPTLVAVMFPKIEPKKAYLTAELDDGSMITVRQRVRPDRVAAE